MDLLNKFGLALVICAFTSSVYAQESNQHAGDTRQDMSPGIAFANFVKGQLFFRFPQQFDIDWGKYSPEKIRALDMGRLSSADLQLINSGEDNFAYKSLKFDLPVPAAIQGRHYYLLTSRGVEEVGLAGLKGYAKFNLLEGGRISPEPIEYYGDVIASYSFKGSAMEGGFVLVSSEPLKIFLLNDENLKKDFSAKAEVREIRYSYLRGKQTLSLTVQRNHLVAMDSLYKFRIEGLDMEYLFVTWHPDATCQFGCCGTGYSLFRAGQALSELAGTVLGCDV